MKREEKIMAEMLHNLMAAADAAGESRTLSAKYLLTAGLGATIALVGCDVALAQSQALVAEPRKELD